MAAVAAQRSAFLAAPAAPAKRAARAAAARPVTVALAQQGTSRREALLAGMAALAVVALPQKAEAGLFGSSASDQEKYASFTTSVIASTRATLNLAKEDPTREASILQLRKDTNQWVATYRRDDTYSGKPSFSNTYAAVNALAGHFNNFGVKVPLPAKRKDRILQELQIAEVALAKGR